MCAEQVFAVGGACRNAGCLGGWTQSVPRLMETVGMNNSDSSEEYFSADDEENIR